MEAQLPKKAPIARPRRLKPVDLDHLELKLLVVLRREADRLLDTSYTKKLSSLSSKTLVNYLNLLRDLKARKIKELEEMTDEELEKLATGERK